MNLRFEINHQRMVRVDSTEPINCSVDYLYAFFDFESQDWAGKDIVAIVRNSHSSFRLLLEVVDADELFFKAEIPSDVLTGNILQVSVYSLGESRITSNIVEVPLLESGYSNREYISQSRSKQDIFNRVFQEIAERFDDAKKIGNDLVFYSEGVEKKRVTIGGGGGVETDPIFTASPAHGIQNTDITNWNGKRSPSEVENDIQGMLNGLATEILNINL